MSASILVESRSSILGGVGPSGAMRALRTAVEDATEAGRDLVLYGEPGSGRRWTARLVHALSPRERGPLIEADARSLHADELPRLVGAASRGTLLLRELDEADDACRVAAALTASTRDPERARIIATATDGAASDGVLLTDQAITLRIPPVRERPREDVAVVITALHQALCADLAAAPSRLDDEVTHRLLDHPWPGNVREIRNVLERALLSARGAPTVTVAHLPAEIRAVVPSPATLAEVERAHIERTVRRHGGNRTRAARELGIARATLINKIRAYALDV